MMQRVLQRTLPHVDRRIDWRVDRKLEERVLSELPRHGESLAALSADLSELSEKLLFGMSELRRWMSDDLEAATETTVLLGESLSRLQTAVEALGGEVATIGQRLAGIEAELAGRSTTQPA
jgi:hypothetical protein